jgi:hypothetical protein
MADEEPAAIRRLLDEIVSLRDIWTQYKKLFMSSEERVTLLNHSGRWFFYLVQRLMVERMMLSLSRLSDPPEMGKNRNLTVAILLDDQRLDKYPEVRAEIIRAVDKLQSATAAMRVHRNMLIAHLDRHAAVTPAEAGLPAVTTQDIEDALRCMEGAYRRYRLELDQSDQVFELFALGGADRLIERLEDAEKWRRHEQARLRRELGIPAPGGDAA